MARQDDIDAVLHLGDYLSEYGPDGYGGEVGAQLGRQHLPAREIISLEDYRQRHAQYKADPGTQAMHAAHPMIAIWDDHETANDSFTDGAENHQPEAEGDWATRKNAALQAYYEWMPVREPEPGRTREALFRDFSWGKFLSLSALESRLMARTEPLDYADFGDELATEEGREAIRRDIIADPSRELLGEAQLKYFDKVIRQSVTRGDTWRVVANQVVMAEVILPDVTGYVTEEQIIEFEKKWDRARAFVDFTKLGMPFNLDAWDGYPAARQRFYEMVQKAGARDLIVLTGDTHEACGNDLYADDDTKMGVEIGTTGLTSPGFFSYLGEGAAFDFSLLMRRDNRDVRFHDPIHKGYFTLTLNEDEGRVDYIGLSTILSPTYEAFRVASLDIVQRNGSLEFGGKSGLGFKERVVFAAR
ncbi:MAG: alkaline phosphatase D family protein, partial [Pseudomonadota bacterium]